MGSSTDDMDLHQTQVLPSPYGVLVDLSFSLDIGNLSMSCGLHVLDELSERLVWKW